MHGVTLRTRTRALTRTGLCLFGVLLGGCAQGESAPSSAKGSRNAEMGSREDPGGVELVDAAVSRGARANADESGPGDAGRARAQTGSAGPRAASSREAQDNAPDASPEGSVRDRDAGPSEGTADAASADLTPDGATSMSMSMTGAPEPASSGSCCSEGSGPGCGDPELQQCVCALAPRCCSEAWDDSCARLVREKNCQSGVRDCVCGNGEGQWQQAYCCEGGWNATCESVSIHKCGATAACP